MEKARTLSLVPPLSYRGDTPDVEAWLAETVPVLRSIAHALATTEGLYTAHAAPQLREETFQLRVALAARLGEAPLGAGPQIAAPQSAPFARKARAIELELQDAALEILVEGLDVPSLAAAVRKADTTAGFGDAADVLVTVANLFDLAIARDHGLEIAPERVPVTDLLEHVARSAWPVARARGVTLMCDSDTPTVLGDPDLLRRGLVALVERAITQMPAGSTLEVSVANGAFDVSFTGAFREDTPSPMAGLDLAFAREALGAHGARVDAGEERGRTLVHFALPLRERKVALRRAA
jgi:signal transduction histidine kinase